MIDVVRVVSQVVVTQWCLSGSLILAAKLFTGTAEQGWLRPQRWFWAELRPFYLPAATVLLAVHVMRGEALGWTGISDALQYLNWWLLKNVDDPDDRWKRRRKKAADKVKTLASGRLAVVPAGAS